MKAFRRIRYGIYILLSVFYALALLPVALPFLRANPSHPITLLDDGWSVTLNETVADDVPLNSSLSKTMDKGDAIILTNTLPEEVPRACLEIRTVRAAVDVFLGGEHIYAYGNATGKEPIYNHIQSVPLPKGYGGKRVSILLRTNTDNAFTGLYPIAVGSRQDLFLRWVQENVRVLFYGVFLLMYGIFLMILSTFMFRVMSKDLRILLSALLSLLFGIYTLSYYEIFDFLFESPLINTAFEMLSLYLMPAAVTGFLATIRGGMTRRIFTVMSVMSSVITVVCTVLHFANVWHFNQTLPLFHIILVLESVTCLVLMYNDVKSGRSTRLGAKHWWKERIFMRRADRILFMGVIAIILGGLANTITYNFRSLRTAEGTATAGIELMCLGILVFVGCLLQNYFFYTVEHSNELMLNRQLSDVAYTDPLTGLANRTRCEQTMRQLEEAKVDYSILSFDVNDLKQTNDTLGHAAGDRLLQGFAGLLKECFRDSDLIGRMGGDEFIVILRNTPKSVCTQKAEQMAHIMERANRTEKGFQYGASIGYAHKSELLNATISDIYHLADDRMYEEKRRYHKKEAVHA